MKTALRYIYTLSLLLIVGAATALISQTAPPPSPTEIIDTVRDATSWGDLLNIETGLYVLLITIGGYLSAFIPGLNKISDGTWRVLTWAILVIAGAAIIGKSVWIPAIAYFFSTSLYEIVLKWIVKSPKPEPHN
jgi:hypothetical protein